MSREEVQRRIGKKEELGITINKIKLEYLGPQMKYNKYKILQLIIAGRRDNEETPK